MPLTTCTQTIYECELLVLLCSRLISPKNTCTAYGPFSVFSSSFYGFSSGITALNIMKPSLLLTLVHTLHTAVTVCSQCLGLSCLSQQISQETCNCAWSDSTPHSGMIPLGTRPVTLFTKSYKPVFTDIAPRFFLNIFDTILYYLFIIFTTIIVTHTWKKL